MSSPTNSPFPNLPMAVVLALIAGSGLYIQIEFLLKHKKASDRRKWDNAVYFALIWASFFVLICWGIVKVDLHR